MSEAFDRGKHDAHQDICEGCHYASLAPGGSVVVGVVPDPFVTPNYIDKANRKDYIAGYCEAIGHDRLNVLKKTKYLKFIELKSTGKTKKVEIISHHGMRIALIKWYGPWRQYGVFPDSNTIWNPDCLNDVSEFLTELTLQYKNS